MRIAIERAARPGLQVGICGEQGGHAASIALFHTAGLDYAAHHASVAATVAMASSNARFMHSASSPSSRPRSSAAAMAVVTSLIAVTYAR